MPKEELTHFDSDGRVQMVDVTAKAETSRRALAAGQIRLTPEVMARLKAGGVGKGDPVSVAELAGVMGAKKTSDLIPLCHPLPLSSVNIRITSDDTEPVLRVEAEVKTKGTTGVEMEALTAVSIACLTLYDMLKAVDKGMVIGEVRLLEKDGGKSGNWRREDGDG